MDGYPGDRFNDAEYNRSPSAVAANAIGAYRTGSTGQGIKVAVIDSGINPAVRGFGDRIDPASQDLVGNRGLVDTANHGTGVSSIIASARDGEYILGVAFEATILSLNASDLSCTESDCSFGSAAIAHGIDVARENGARVINISLGGPTASQDILDAVGRASSNGIVIVVAAGNDGDATPDGFATQIAGAGNGLVIIAGAHTQLGDIASFSDRAGPNSPYLLALGENVEMWGSNDRPLDENGTSFSAPAIAGAVALLAQAFPNLTGAQIVDLLFRTAIDLGPAGRDSTYGYGDLSIARAFQPVGTLSLAGTRTPVSQSSLLPAAAGDASTGRGASLSAVILDYYKRAFVIDLAKTLRSAPHEKPLASAIGGNFKVGSAIAGPVSLAMTLSGQRDHPGSYQLDRLRLASSDAAASRLIAASAIARIDSRTTAGFGFGEGAKVIERRLSGVESGAFLIARNKDENFGFVARRGGSLVLRRELGSFGLTLSGESGEVWNHGRIVGGSSNYRWTGVDLDHRFARTWVSLGVSELEEKQSVLGGRLSDALDGSGARSQFFDLELRRMIGSAFSVGATIRRGWTRFSGGSFVTAAYGVDLTRKGLVKHSDRVALRIAQPLRVEKGGLKLLLPTTYDYQTGVATDSWQQFPLTPSGREIDTEFSYTTDVFRDGGWLGFNLFVRKDPSHISHSPADPGGAIRFSLAF